MTPQAPAHGLTLRPLSDRGSTSDGLLCVDLEDWHQILQQQLGASPRHCPVPFRRGLDALLDLLDRHNQKATFFVLGMTVAGSQSVVRELSDLGHEIATHGFDHIHLERRTTDEFREDLKRALGQLGELIGEPILGHRAPEFSIPRDRVGAFFDVLAELGLRYDSSVYPVDGERYGLAGFPRSPQRVETAYGPVIELPLATAFAKVEARSLVADAAVKVAVLSALRGLLVEASDAAFAGALSMEPSPGAATVAPFARTRLKRPAGADASAWAAREAELVAWFEGGE